MRNNVKVKAVVACLLSCFICAPAYAWDHVDEYDEYSECGNGICEDDEYEWCYEDCEEEDLTSVEDEELQPPGFGVATVFTGIASRLLDMTGSYIVNQVFSFTNPPNAVELSDDALEKIQDIVRQEVRAIWASHYKARSQTVLDLAGAYTRHCVKDCDQSKMNETMYIFRESMALINFFTESEYYTQPLLFAQHIQNMAAAHLAFATEKVKLEEINPKVVASEVEESKRYVSEKALKYLELLISLDTQFDTYIGELYSDVFIVGTDLREWAGCYIGPNGRVCGNLRRYQNGDDRYGATETELLREAAYLLTADKRETRQIRRREILGDHFDENLRDIAKLVASDECGLQPGLYDYTDDNQAVTSWREGRLDLFIKGADNGLWHRTYVSNVWSCWKPLGGLVTSGPAVASWNDGRLDVFVRGGDNALYHKSFDGGWSDWEGLGGVLTSAPAVASWSRGRLDVFVRGTDNALHHKSFDGEWSDWQGLGGVLTSAPAVTSGAPGRLDVFVRGTDNGLHRRWFDGTWTSEWDWDPRFDDGRWSDWTYVAWAGVVASAPAAVSWGPGRVDLFFKGITNYLAHAYYENNDYLGFEWFEGGLTSAPAVASAAQGILDVFVRGGGNALHYKSYISTRGWSGLAWTEF
jgi:hypothetical protein